MWPRLSPGTRILRVRAAACDEAWPRSHLGFSVSGQDVGGVSRELPSNAALTPPPPQLLTPYLHPPLT